MSRPVLTPLDGVAIIGTDELTDASVTRVKLAPDTLPSTAAVATAQATSSLAYVDLATVGPDVTLITGTVVRVHVMATCTNLGGNGVLGVAVSGATTVAAPAGNQVAPAGGTDVTLAPASAPAGQTLIITGLTAGSNTFRMRYKVIGGATQTFSNRLIVVDRLN